MRVVALCLVNSLAFCSLPVAASGQGLLVTRNSESEQPYDFVRIDILKLRFDKQPVPTNLRCQMQLRKQDALLLKEAATEFGISITHSDASKLR